MNESDWIYKRSIKEQENKFVDSWRDVDSWLQFQHIFPQQNELPTYNDSHPGLTIFNNQYCSSWGCMETGCTLNLVPVPHKIIVWLSLCVLYPLWYMLSTKMTRSVKLICGQYLLVVYGLGNKLLQNMILPLTKISTNHITIFVTSTGRPCHARALWSDDWRVMTMSEGTPSTAVD